MNDIPCGTVDGNLHNLADFYIGNITLEAISIGLSNQCRYNGQVRKFYSVAEHCVHLCRYARETGLYDEEIQKQLLMHDASEAYVGDVIRGLKDTMPEFIKLEEDVIKKIFTRFDIKYPYGQGVKELDRNICRDEMRKLMPIRDFNLLKWVNGGERLGIKIKCWSPAKARKQFLKECERLNIR